MTLGEGRQDTRRRVARSELDALEVEGRGRQVVDTFGRHRLLTFDREPSTREPTVEIAHEALLSAWHAYAAGSMAPEKTFVRSGASPARQPSGGLRS